ncbi:hypothetical protein [Georgenia sp. Z1491]|uniref:hypothetical protein n=1 Tax=Georgenia sp. Z1491 TaxID=3416707 RepID=UPI003CEF808C
MTLGSSVGIDADIDPITGTDHDQYVAVTVADGGHIVGLELDRNWRVDIGPAGLEHSFVEAYGAAMTELTDVVLARSSQMFDAFEENLAGARSGTSLTPMSEDERHEALRTLRESAAERAGYAERLTQLKTEVRSHTTTDGRLTVETRDGLPLAVHVHDRWGEGRDATWCARALYGLIETARAAQEAEMQHLAAEFPATHRLLELSQNQERSADLGRTTADDGKDPS